MQPWKSQRVEGRRQEEGGGGAARRWHRKPAVEPSLSASPMRPAASRMQALSSDLPIELISSPSRGLDASDSTRDLTNSDTQARYRQYISQRIQSHSDKHGRLSDRDLFPITLPSAALPSSTPRWAAAGLEGAVLESLQDVMLLVRRLREGCIAASRRDAFTADVYALSTLLSILIGDDIQLSSSLPRLVDLMATAVPCDTNGAAEGDILALLGSGSPSSMPPVLDRAHVVSLYLLWLSVTGGEVTRIGGGQRETRRPGGAWLQERTRVLADLSEEEQGSHWIEAVDDLHAAVARDNVVRLRALLLADRCSIWQRAIVRRAVDRMRKVVWTTLCRAYLHAPLDYALVGEGGEGTGADDWLERMLFIDTHLVPPAGVDALDQATAALASTTLNDGNKPLNPTRAARLAAVLKAYGLSESASDTGWPGPLSEWSGRRVVQGGTTALKLR